MKRREVCWAEDLMNVRLLVGNISNYGVVLQTVTKGVVAKTSPTEKRKLLNSRAGRGPRAAQFSHFSVKELLTLKPLATLSRAMNEAN
jgi:hypothetical protein